MAGKYLRLGLRPLLGSCRSEPEARTLRSKFSNNYFTASLPVYLAPPVRELGLVRAFVSLESTTISTLSMLLHELPTHILIAFLCRYDLKDVLRLGQVK